MPESPLKKLLAVKLSNLSLHLGSSSNCKCFDIFYAFVRKEIQVHLLLILCSPKHQKPLAHGHRQEALEGLALLEKETAGCLGVNIRRGAKRLEFWSLLPSDS